MPETEPFITTLQEWIDVSMRRSMHSFIRYAKESGFSMSQFGALSRVHHMGKCGVTDLGDHLGVTSAAASQLLDRLVQQGLLLREEDPDDRRVKQIVLTEKGRRMIEGGFRAQKAWLNELEDSLSEDEKVYITPALRTLIDKARLITQHNELEN